MLDSALPTRFENISRENINRAINEFDELIDRLKNTFSGEGLSLAERYLKGEMGVGIEFRFMERVPCEFVAFFQRKLATQVDDFAGHCLMSDANQAASGRNDGTMFVEDIEAVECPIGTTFPATVRFEAAQDFFAGVIERQLCEAIGKPFRRPMYRKRYVTQCLLGNEGPCRSPDGDADRQRIKRASEIVNTVSNEPAKIYRDMLDYMQSVDPDCRLRIPICDNFVGVSLGKRIDKRLQVFSVFFGPINLYSTAQKRVFDHGKVPKEGTGSHQGSNGRIIAPAA
jgi:hypothetical protein